MAWQVKLLPSVPLSLANRFMADMPEDRNSPISEARSEQSDRQSRMIVQQPVQSGKQLARVTLHPRDGLRQEASVDHQFDSYLDLQQREYLSSSIERDTRSLQKRILAIVFD